LGCGEAALELCWAGGKKAARQEATGTVGEHLVVEDVAMLSGKLDVVLFALLLYSGPTQSADDDIDGLSQGCSRVPGLLARRGP
jgi:hypothetical protein